MPVQNDGDDGDDGDMNREIPTALAEPVRGVSWFWLIPLVAAAIGAWLAWDAYRQRGPEIEIVFARGDGIEAGKTTVRYKAVAIGEIIAVGLSADLKSVRVTARIDRQFAAHLTDATRFWVVRPRIGARGVSGLSTLVSGAYVEMDPAPGQPARAFTGLDAPPIVTSDAPGSSYVLTALTLGNVSPGAPLVFKDIEVGEVLGYELAADGTEVAIHVFVREAYAGLVRENSRFWVSGALNLTLGADGVGVNAPSLQQLIRGGIAFDAPAGGGDRPAPSGTSFHLFDSYEAISEARITERVQFVAYFDESVRGLSVDAPVEFRGIKVGEVTRVALDTAGGVPRSAVPVELALHPQRLGMDAGAGAASISALVAQGMRARLQTASLLTGQLYVELVIAPATPAASVSGSSSLPQIPTLPTELAAFKDDIRVLLADLRDFPLQQLGERSVAALAALERAVSDPELGRAIASARGSFESLERLAVELEHSLQPVRTDLQRALAGYQEGSAMYEQLSTTLQQLERSARALRDLANTVEAQPESLLWGRGEQGE